MVDRVCNDARPLFSVITICYNDKNGLAATQSSVAKQVFDDFEWVVVDGGSVDGTKEYLEKLQPSFRYIWISESDKGIYNAMNKGIKMAKGQFFVFMNSGDCFYDSLTLKNVAYLITNSTNITGFIYGDSIDCLEDGNKFYRSSRSITWLKFGMITHHQSMFFNSSVVKDVTYNENLKYSSDYQYVCETVKQCNGEGIDIMQVDFPVSMFQLGGAHQLHRSAALREDYYIRKTILGLNVIASGSLYVLHYAHMLIKNYFRQSHEFFRYRKS